MDVKKEKEKNLDQLARLMNTSLFTPSAACVSHMTLALQVIAVHQESPALHMQRRSSTVHQRDCKRCYPSLCHSFPSPFCLHLSPQHTDKHSIILHNAFQKSKKSNKFNFI